MLEWLIGGDAPRAAGTVAQFAPAFLAVGMSAVIWLYGKYLVRHARDRKD